jgi:hypothetical protein
MMSNNNWKKEEAMMRRFFGVLFFMSVIALECMEHTSATSLSSSKKRKKLRREKALTHHYYKTALAVSICYQFYHKPYQSTHVPLEHWFAPDQDESLEQESNEILKFADHVCSQLLPDIPCRNYTLINMLDYDDWVSVLK